MSSVFNVWIEIEEHDLETDQYTTLDCPGAAMACFESYEQALALVPVLEAASELLAACETFLSLYSEKMRAHPDIKIACESARAAIAKAKGEVTS